jgi:hypothetical protein
VGANPQFEQVQRRAQHREGVCGGAARLVVRPAHAQAGAKSKKPSEANIQDAVQHRGLSVCLSVQHRGLSVCLSVCCQYNTEVCLSIRYKYHTQRSVCPPCLIICSCAQLLSITTNLAVLRQSVCLCVCLSSRTHFACLIHRHTYTHTDTHTSTART